MTIEQCYKELGGDLDAVMGRLLKKERVEKFLLRVPKDPSFQQLEEAFGRQDWQQAFAAAHTLKGVSANMDLGNLNRAAHELTESLRNGVSADSQKLYEQTKDAWKDACRIIEEYKASSGL
ncbi:MAG: Hpt domain-containing protein [Ileibacterium sp.]|mgnify:CR=1 FL=1|nr:Hpt domain-containing protein [Ileibacterium sp.]